MNQVNYADYDSSVVVNKARELTKHATTIEERLEKLFYYVRDDIAFGFHPETDYLTATEIIHRRVGQCNNKSTLLLALCRAIDIPAKIHFSLIKKEIQQGLFRGMIFRLMPKYISHSWVDVEVNGRLVRLDSYINDAPFYYSAKEQLAKEQLDTGYSVACSSGESSIDFNIHEEKFVQMDAVTDDHGAYDEPADYYKTKLYNNNVNPLKMLIYRLNLPSINHRVELLRAQCIDCVSNN